MKYLTLLSLLAVGAASSQTMTSQKPVECFDTEPLFRGLMGTEYKERPVWGGVEPGAAISKYILFVNQETKAWTLIQFDEKVSCVLGTGEASKLIIEGPVL